MNVFNVVSYPFTDDRIILPHLTLRTKHELSSIEEVVKRTKNKLNNIFLKPPDSGSVVPSGKSFFHGLYSDISEKWEEGQP